MSSFLLTINEDPGKYFFFQVIGWGLLWFGCGSSPKDFCVESLVSSMASVSAITATLGNTPFDAILPPVWCMTAANWSCGGGTRGSGLTSQQ